MTTEAITEWRLMWGDDQIGETGTKPEILARLDDTANKLKGLSIPTHNLRAEGRIVEVTRVEFPWKWYGEIEQELREKENRGKAQAPGQNKADAGPQPGPMEKGHQFGGRHSAQLPNPTVDPMMFWPPSAEQILRVRKGEFTFHAPCVICGVTFNDCPHSGYQTEQFINAVRVYLKEQRR
jgi:hypothetical protein